MSQDRIYNLENPVDRDSALAALKAPGGALFEDREMTGLTVRCSGLMIFCSPAAFESFTRYLGAAGVDVEQRRCRLGDFN